MAIPDRVSEVTFLYGGMLKDGVSYSDIENVLWSAGLTIGIDDHLSWIDLNNFAMIYINYVPGMGEETDLFQIDSDMFEALNKAQVWQ